MLELQWQMVCRMPRLSRREKEGKGGVILLFFCNLYLGMVLTMPKIFCQIFIFNLTSIHKVIYLPHGKKKLVVPWTKPLRRRMR